MSDRTGMLIKNCRKAAGMTQKDLAKRVGMTRSTLACYESGTNEPPYDRVRELVSACGFDLILQKKREAWK